MMRLKIFDGGECQKKDCCGGGGQSDQRDIDDAMDFLAATAVLAIGEMQFVVAAHFRRQAGNIVTPSRKDFPHDRFHTGTHNMLKPDGFENLHLSCHPYRFRPPASTTNEGPFCRHPSSLDV